MEIEKEYPLEFDNEEPFGLDITVMHYKITQMGSSPGRRRSKALDSIKKILKKEGTEYEEYHGLLHIINPEFSEKHDIRHYVEATRIISRKRLKPEVIITKNENFKGLARDGGPIRSVYVQPNVCHTNLEEEP